MATRGKNINLFLMDGEPSERIKCTLANWTGVAYKIPRTHIDKCKEREDLSQSGVYFLFGISDDTGKNVAYIGQAGVRKTGEGIICRLQEHKRNENKDYWTEAVVFTTSNNSFGATEISYLENRFTNMAKDANRYMVKNDKDPNLGNVTEEKESELEEFIDYAKMIIGTLGHKVFEPLTKMTTTVETEGLPLVGDELVLYINRKSRTSGQPMKASCKRTVDGFVVLKDSQIELEELKNIPIGVKIARQSANVDDNGVLLEDTLFKSPSYAASFVIGGNANGLIEWKTSDGKPLKEAE